MATNRRRHPYKPVCSWLGCTNDRVPAQDFCGPHLGQPCAYCTRPIVRASGYVQTLGGMVAHLTCYLKHRAQTRARATTGSASPRLAIGPVDDR